MLRVMVVDDEALIRSGLSLILDAAPDIEVVGACEGTEALEEVARTNPTVVLLDIRMPGMDGLSILRALRQLPKPPVAAMLTTFDAGEHIESALREGAAGYLLKDTPPTQLIEAVRTLADGHRVLSAGATRTVIDGYLANRADLHALQMVESMTARERDVLALIGEGLSNADIGRRLYLGAPTVKDYVSAVLGKLSATNRVQAAVIAQRAGLVHDEESTP